MSLATRISRTGLIFSLILFNSHLSWGKNINKEMENKKSSEVLQKPALGWPSYLQNNQRSGVTDENLELNMTEQWRYDLAQKPTPSWPLPARGSYWQRLKSIKPRVVYDQVFHIVATNQRIFFGSSSDDQLYCLNANNGKVLWRFFANAPIRFAPSVSKKKIYFGSDDGFVYCLDAENANLIWKYQVAVSNRQVIGNGRMISVQPVRTSVVIDDGILYCCAGIFPSQGVSAIALNAENGELIWREKLNGLSPQGYLLTSRNRLYVPTGRTNPFALDKQNGRYLRSFESSGGSYTLLTDNEIISGPGNDGSLRVSDVHKSDHLATFRGNHIVITPKMSYLHTDTEISALDRVQLISLRKRQRQLQDQQESLHQRMKSDSEQEQAKAIQNQLENVVRNLEQTKLAIDSCISWKKPCGHPYSLIKAGSLLFAGGEGEVAAYETKSGQIVWTGKVSGKAYGLAVANRQLIVSTDQGAIHCFSAKKSTANQQAHSKNPNTTSPFSKTSKYTGIVNQIMSETSITKGFCLIIGTDSGQLAYEIATRSNLKVLAIDQNTKKTRKARMDLATTGIYGTHVSIQKIVGNKLPFTDYFANIVLINNQQFENQIDRKFKTEIDRVLRPCGGVVYQILSDSATKIQERGRLPNSGEWTHQYADLGSSACSTDQHINDNLSIQWFGRPGPRRMIDRHLRTAPPLFSYGRLFIPGNDRIIAVDGYNGTELWDRQIVNSLRIAIPYDTSYMAADKNRLYVAVEERCLIISAQTGQNHAAFSIPELIGKSNRHWGYVAVTNNMLFGSVQKTTASRTEQSYKAIVDHYKDDQPLVVSEGLFAVDLVNNRLIWQYHHGIIPNTTITIGDGKVFFFQSRNPKATNNKVGRVTAENLLNQDASLVAIESKTGNLLWERPFTLTPFRHSLYLSYANDTLIAVGSINKNDQTWYLVHAWNGNDGTFLWTADHRNSRSGIGGDHGEQVHHPAIVGNIVIAEPTAYDLRTGKRRNPAGKASNWMIPIRSGCGTITASSTCIFYRDSNPTIMDFNTNSLSKKITHVSRPGCWLNIIPAGGLVLIPEASSSCVCAFPLQTSMAFLPQRSF